MTASNVVLPDAKDVDAHLYGESSKGKEKCEFFCTFVIVIQFIVIFVPLCYNFSFFLFVDGIIYSKLYKID